MNSVAEQNNCESGGNCMLELNEKDQVLIKVEPNTDAKENSHGELSGGSSNLKKHQKAHSGEKPYYCDLCGKGFSKREHLKRHEKTHTGEKPFGCVICGKYFTRKEGLQRHQKVHTGEMPYECGACGKRFSEKSHLERHGKLHMPKSFHKEDINLNNVDESKTASSCSIHEAARNSMNVTGESESSELSSHVVKNECDSNFVTASSEENQLTDAPVEEENCQAVWPAVKEESTDPRDENRQSAELLQSGEFGQQNTDSPPELSLKSDSQQQRNNEKRGRGRRRKIKETDEQSFKCGVCGKVYTYHCNLIVHMRVHTGEKPFTCSLCGESFARVNYVNLHMRMHTGEKPYECDICGMKFTISSNFKAHRRSHTGERPYECDICGKGFHQASHRWQHRKTHFGEKPFQCNVCNKFFSRMANLRVHEKIHVGKEMVEKPSK